GAADPARLLALPDERLPAVRLPVRLLRGAGTQLRGWAVRCRALRVAAGRRQHGAAAALVDHLRLRSHCDATPAAQPRAGLARTHRAARSGLRRYRALRIRPPDPRRLRPAAQRLPVGVLRAGGHPRPARERRHHLAGHADGAGAQARPGRCEPSPRHVPVDVLALPRRGVDRRLHLCIPDGRAAMSEHIEENEELEHDTLHITVGGYVTGFVLAVILTAIPFWLVMGKVLESPTVTTFIILALAMVQIYVHMVFFLHMTSKAEGGWAWMSLIFPLVLLVITLSGSLWITYHLKTNTMPLMPEQARKLP